MEGEGAAVVEDAVFFGGLVPVARAVVGEVAVLVDVDVEFAGLALGFIDGEVGDAVGAVAELKAPYLGLAL